MESLPVKNERVKVFNASDAGCCINLVHETLADLGDVDLTVLLIGSVSDVCIEAGGNRAGESCESGSGSEDDRQHKKMIWRRLSLRVKEGAQKQTYDSRCTDRCLRSRSIFSVSPPDGDSLFDQKWRRSSSVFSASSLKNSTMTPPMASSAETEAADNPAVPNSLTNRSLSMAQNSSNAFSGPER